METEEAGRPYLPPFVLAVGLERLDPMIDRAEVDLEAVAAQLRAEGIRITALDLMFRWCQIVPETPFSKLPEEVAAEADILLHMPGYDFGSVHRHLRGLGYRVDVGALDARWRETYR